MARAVVSTPEATAGSVGIASPVRLAFVSREYPPVTAYTGGIGTTYAALAPALAELGVDCHVLTIGRGGEQRIGGVDVRPLGTSSRGALGHMEWMVRVRAELARLDPDVAVSPDWGGDAWLYALRGSTARVVTNLQTSLTQMTAISPGSRPTWSLRAYRVLQVRLERLQAEHSSAVVACSKAVLRWASDLWRIDSLPSCVIPNTVDVGRITRLAGKPLLDGWPERRPVVLFVGRLEPRKGAHLLVPAMKAVWAEFPDAQLVLLGGDAEWQGGSMVRAVRAQAGDRVRSVHVLGGQAPESVFRALRAADAVALPSLWEAFGVAALESMALGRPTVVASGSGPDDFFRHGVDGLMTSPGNSEEVGAALVRLLQDRELRSRIAADAPQRAQQFDAGVVAPRFLRFFHALMDPA